MPTRSAGWTLSDERWMRHALALARRGQGLTRPNPPVGAVVVRRGRRVGQGFHPRAGAPHAEVLAIAEAGPAARGATLYVTLEPCSTFGRTPPCTDLIRKAGLARVVVAVRDPNPRHEGKGIRILRRAGIHVAEGVLAAEGADLIRPFAKWITGRLPWVTLKLGMTVDGRIADARRRSRWITSPAARREVDELRRIADAILVGAGTACADDPSLRRRGRKRNHLYRVIVDSAGRLPPRARVLTDEARDMTLVATTSRCSAARRARYEACGARVWVLPACGGRVSLRSLLRGLGRMGLLHVVCEGGGELARSLVDARLVDEFVFFVAPRLLGGQGAVPAIGGPSWALAAAPALRFTEVRRVGPDVRITAVPQVGE